MSVSRLTYLKIAVFVACLVPAGLLVARTFANQLGANPVETLEHESGLWALRFLLITLAITPLRQWTGWSDLIRLRRMLGLFTFFYVFCHTLMWLVFDHFFDLDDIIKDVIKRPYITFGFVAFVMLIPLAVTSTDRAIRRLGKRWKSLHRTVYIIAVLAVFHFLFLVKADFRDPLIYAAIMVFLLLVRSIWWAKVVAIWKNAKSTRSAAPSV